jgi:hypothetical protein
MGMLKEAIDRIIDLAPPDEKTIDGITYVRRTMVKVAPPRAVPFRFATLKGFCDFIESAKPDSLPELRINVASPFLVNLFGPLDLQHRDRESFAIAEFSRECGFKFGERYQAEDFTIALATLFDETPNRERLTKLVGNMTADHAITSTDDGISQTVGQKAGVTLVKTEKIQNPFQLSPHRTFPEVAQPRVPFIFRVHQVGGQIPMPALYECDNGAWKLEAVKSIAAWLSAELKKRKLDDKVPVIA